MHSWDVSLILLTLVKKLVVHIHVNLTVWYLILNWIFAILLSLELVPILRHHLLQLIPHCCLSLPLQLLQVDPPPALPLLLQRRQPQLQPQPQLLPQPLLLQRHLLPQPPQLQLRHLPQLQHRRLLIVNTTLKSCLTPETVTFTSSALNNLRTSTTLLVTVAANSFICQIQDPAAGRTPAKTCSAVTTSKDCPLNARQNSRRNENNFEE